MSFRRSMQSIRNGFTIFREYRSSSSAQKMSPEELRGLQRQRLEKLLRHAWRNVPFYRKRFRDAGLKPADIRSPEDLRYLPPLTKADIREHGAEIVAQGAERPLMKICSSGSTGEPTTVYLDRRSTLRKHAVFLRNLMEAGYRFGERLPQIWGGPWALNCPDRIREGHEMPHDDETGDLMEFCATGVFPSIMLSVFDMNDETMGRFADWLRRHQPSLVTGFTVPLDLFAQYLQRTGGEAIRPRGVIATADALLPSVRARFEEVFACPVYNRYATNEVFGIAQECGHADCQPGRMHLHEEAIVVEIAREGKPVDPGESGHVLVTDLQNYAMPLIRYDLEDVASIVPEACPCGRPSALLSQVEGRVDEFFLLPGERLISAAFFRNMFQRNPGIARYQVLQDEPRQIDVRIIREPARFDNEAFERSRRTILDYLGTDIQVRIEFVDHIDWEENGKFRFIRSQVYQDWLSNKQEEPKLEEALT